MNFWKQKKREVLEAEVTDLNKETIIYKVAPDEKIEF